MQRCTGFFYALFEDNLNKNQKELGFLREMYLLCNNKMREYSHNYLKKPIIMSFKKVSNKQTIQGRNALDWTTGLLNHVGDYPGEHQEDAIDLLGLDVEFEEDQWADVMEGNTKMFAVFADGQYDSPDTEFTIVEVEWDDDSETKILSSHTEESVPFVLVRANDESDAEIFADENAAEFDDYFEGMKTSKSQETSEEGVYRVNFVDA